MELLAAAQADEEAFDPAARLQRILEDRLRDNEVDPDAVDEIWQQAPPGGFHVTSDEASGTFGADSLSVDWRSCSTIFRLAVTGPDGSNTSVPLGFDSKNQPTFRISMPGKAAVAAAVSI